MRGAFLTRLFAEIADAVFPPRCPLCDLFVERSGAPCADCEAALCRLESPAFTPGIGKSILSPCLSCFAYEGRIQEALHRFKYNGRLDIAGYFAQELFETASRTGRFDMLVPVPLHTRRLRERGFNQSALLARRLGKLMSVPVELDSLVRGRDVKPQVGLSREERAENVRGAFSVKPGRGKVFEGSKVLLIDDVMTTGATLAWCARPLKDAGADEVAAITVARAL
ncbi:MAG TPA: ComF family protein [bacterium]|nr:ComF family protein [bacterium]